MKRKKAGQPFNEMKKRRRKKNDSHMAMKKGTEFLNKKIFWYFKHFPAKEKKNCFRFWDFFFFWRKISDCPEVWNDSEFFWMKIRNNSEIETILMKLCPWRSIYENYALINIWYLNKRLFPCRIEKLLHMPLLMRIKLIKPVQEGCSRRIQ